MKNKCKNCKINYADLIDLHNQKFLCKNCWMNQFEPADEKNEYRRWR